MNAALVASILLAASFTGVAIWRKRALPESISSLVYVFRWKWLWTVWLSVVGLLTCIPTIDVLDTKDMGFLGFLTLACLLFCAAMPIFMRDWKRWHDILGISACVLSQACVSIVCAVWLFAWALFVFLMGSVYVQPQGRLAKAVKGNGVFMAEATCYVSMVGSLLFG